MFIQRWFWHVLRCNTDYLKVPGGLKKDQSGDLWMSKEDLKIIGATAEDTEDGVRQSWKAVVKQLRVEDLQQSGLDLLMIFKMSGVC